MTRSEENGKFIVFYPLEDNTAAQLFEAAGILVKTIHLGSNENRFALIEVGTEEEAAALQHEFDNFKKKQQRDLKRKQEKEESYDRKLEDGFDIASGYGDLSETMADSVVFNALSDEFQKLTKEQKEICKGVGNKISDRSMAGKLGMAKSTYQGKKAKVLNDLRKKMKEYR